MPAAKIASMRYQSVSAPTTKLITTLTTLSLSAIATNTEIKTGGVYYMISRTLGADFGGAIGLLLYVAMSISIAFYAIGLGEAVARMKALMLAARQP